MRQETTLTNKIISVQTSSFYFFLPYLVPILTVLTHYSSNPFHPLIPPIFVWIFIPLLDTLIPQKQDQLRSLTRPQRTALENRKSFKLAVLLWCPTHLILLIWGTQEFLVPQHLARRIGLVLSMGLIAAEGINAAHELLHRQTTLERTIANLMLVSVCYGHFAIEHARGHHRRVATPTDPATMRFQESFYMFLPRTLIRSYISAWKLETKRLTSFGQPVVSIKNHMVLYALSQLTFVISFWMFGGIRALAFFVIQAAIAIVLLEQVNAIEHYGLMRKKMPSGEYEHVGPRHSWDAPHRVSSYFMFKLQLHADHHLRKFHLMFALFSPERILATH